MAEKNLDKQQSLFSDDASRVLSDKEKFNWLRLIRTENVGPITFSKLLVRFGSAGKALEALPSLSANGGRKNPLVACEESIVIEELNNIEKYGARLIAKCEPDYPYLLKQLEDAPPMITVLGNVDLLQEKCCAIVGTRNASINGRKMAQMMAKSLGLDGYNIVSGLARGIDTCAHQASVETGTIAVVAGGIDVVYPKENEALYAAIAEKGAIVAESPFGTQPQARHFPKRNRIISGLSLGCLVVEANLKSGSLITARMTLEQNRELFCVPGSPLDPRAKGTNKLLQENSAHLVVDTQDVLNILNSLRVSPLFESTDEFDMSDFGSLSPVIDVVEKDDVEQLREEICMHLDTTPVHVDELIRSCKAPIPQILSILLELELAGRLERHTGNKVNLI